MHTHLKHLTYKMYLISGIILMALMFGIWLFSNAFLSIKVNPKDATVTVDNEQIQLNSFGIGKSRLALGTHTIKIEADGYVSSIKTVRFKRGFTTSLKASLREIPQPTSIAEGGKFLARGNNDNEFFYLGNNDSTIFRSKIELNDKGEVSVSGLPVTKSDLFGINEIIWSPKKDLALFRKDDGIYLFDFKKYDFVNQTETPWGNNIGSIAWAPDNSKIAYYYATASGEQSIIFSNLDNSSQERIVDLGEYGIQNPTLRWSPGSEWLLVIPKNPGRNSNKLYLLNAYSRELKAIREEGNVLDAIFTPDGSKIIFSTDERQSSPQVSEMNLDGSNILNLSLNAGLNTVSFGDGNQNDIVAAKANDFGSSLFGFNLLGNVEKDFEINFSDSSDITSTAVNKDEKVILYEDSYGIYAISTEQLMAK